MCEFFKENAVTHLSKLPLLLSLCWFNSYAKGQEGAVGSPTEHGPCCKQGEIPASRMRAEEGDILTGTCGNLDSDLSFISQCGSSDLSNIKVRAEGMAGG